MAGNVRIDKWLWAVRIYKTRSKATEACKKGRILMDDLPVKPSREIVSGDIIHVKKAPVTRQYKVLALAEKRMSAKLTDDFVEDITPAEDLELLETQKQMKWFNRKPGTGRPTKKERRKLDDFFGS
ncbi:heat shock protein Hsp15 [Tangfeifania diversioriginum]|uniref:Heat shock protein Hsp15 n=1 Tax=Tangfeifania diversioriginum TaxID=1168035 RepID=A0A1M6FNU0_9BACT|nr:S4 domain-containing protein [Tangfeifania diversioriginum]SHI99346.1 heat shock protein Hsp15 [Tangfeifania diversioriginum]